MSYCRWSNSDLYVYLSVSGYYTCFLCPDGPPPSEENNHSCETVRFTTTEEIISHIKEHITNGLQVPDFTIPALEREALANDEWIAKYPYGDANDEWIAKYPYGD